MKLFIALTLLTVAWALPKPLDPQIQDLTINEPAADIDNDFKSIVAEDNNNAFELSSANENDIELSNADIDMAIPEQSNDVDNAEEPSANVDNDLPSLSELQEIIDIAHSLIEEENLGDSDVRVINVLLDEESPKIEPANGLEAPELNIVESNNIFDEEDMDDEIHDAVLVGEPSVESDDVRVAEAVANDDAFDRLQVVNFDKDTDFRGIMGIAPSELESLRVEFEDEAEPLADEQNDQAIPREVLFSDPNLR
ncbi:unnamed protein product [Leptosia nina]|uniref:Uncharacterized protein n=1 Tax=Leptosia nina TaxID=320188 RepID=A0AAV1JW39_9NEOP